MTSASELPLTLTFGAPEQFAVLRTTLRRLDFTEEAICRRTGAQTIFEFKSAHEGRESARETGDSLDVLIRLLMDEEEVGATHMAMLPDDLRQSLQALGIAGPSPEDSSKWRSTVNLYPVAGLYAASDRTVFKLDAGEKIPTDVVYAAITANTGRFLSALPEEPCDALLDLCSGSGIAAIVAGARYAKRAWATDLGARCVYFSEFNRRLNGLDNVTAAQGDLYGAVGDATFDRIVAHPPYVPAKDRKMLFRDGGEDGEQILARIVAGLPRHLRPGGRFYCVTLATDREGEAFEQRIRSWLGAAEAEFDVILVATESRRRPEKVIDAIVRAKGRVLDLGPTGELYEKLKVTGIFYGTVVIERKTAARPAVTARTQKAERAAGETVEWFRRWETASADPEFTRQLLDSRPRMAANMTLLVTHKPAGSQLAPSSFVLRSTYPLAAEAAIEPWVAVLLGAANGERTVREIYSGFRQDEVIDSTMSESEFTGVVRLLISNAFLEHDAYPLPQ